MTIQSRRRKTIFRLMTETLLALMLVSPLHAAIRPVQHSAREQINALVLSASGQEIDALARRQQWHDYRYTFNVFIPSAIATAALCPGTPHVTPTSAAEMALSRMNFTVSCPGKGGWKVNVAVRPDVYVPVVMPKSLIARDTVITADDVLLKRYNVSGQRSGLLMDLNEAIGMTSKRPLQPGKPLNRAQLVAPVLVKRDQPVMIVSRLGGITAAMPGVALKNGRKGEVIKIRNAASQRIISGVVDDAGVVSPLNTSG
ncbi:flagellar basal body P-ring formation chaperone FlgA [Citrobacter rodentium]|uniref:Flagella basal body P-ring formation protein FlgA n=2 Tax=Citrobacter rodentium TaxID=67825 RepID=D2TJ80_CITRI|nr:flagellar basal body P-ring biosynthesis protein FlgA [Citrobacter rodentium]CBG87087.1 lateral flagellar P-ring addition protein [Citrobacter rodentium ICC168]